MRSRLLFVLAASGIWVCLIACRLYQLQVVRYEHYAGKAGRQQQRVVELDPPRGTIYDARGRELAVSVEVESAYAVPPEIADPRAAARLLAPIVGRNPAKLAALLAADKEFVWVKRKLDPPQVQEILDVGLAGIHFVTESKRYYPMRELGAQLLGFVGTENHGLAGLELIYDRSVAGKPGRRTVLRDARRGTVAAPDLSFSDPEPGQDLHLTLDTTIQHIVERELARAVVERKAKAGSAVFLDPRTGAVLALATYPGFDPNRYGRVPSSRWGVRAIADVYEPGSTFKVITAAAALESGLVHAEDVFDCEMGGITLAGIRIRDHKPFGRLTFAEALAKSSNVGMIKTALLLGDERLFGVASAFGFGRKTGIDLPGESAGILHPLSAWRPISKAYVSFGQGISVTALQLAAAVGAVANGGALVEPHVVAAVGRGGTVERHRRAPRVAGHPVSPATARELARLLEGVVVAGTGKAAAVPGYRVAGKTGTAQKPVDGGYSRSGYVPSFVGFAPADRPVLVGVVAVDEPQGFAYHGGQVAAPVFGAIARQVLLYLGVRPEREPPVAWPGERVTPTLPAPAAPQGIQPPPVLAEGGAEAAPAGAAPEAPGVRVLEAVPEEGAEEPAIAPRRGTPS